MCGRYVLKASAVELVRQFHLDEVPELHARYNIAPMQVAPVILDAHPRTLAVGRWGLLPRWAKDTRLASKLINARAETLAEKPSFRGLLPSHRCLVPCDGFYEWLHEGEARLPHYVHRSDGRLLAMAGLWSPWRSPEGLEVLTFTVVTVPANPEVAPVHDRMPAFLDDEGRAAWLSRATGVETVLSLLQPWAGASLDVTPVSRFVNSAHAEGEGCLQPAEERQLRLL